MKILKLQGESLVTGISSLEYLKEIDFERAIIITGGTSMFKTGIIDKVQKYLTKEGKSICLYSGIGKNPTTEEVLNGLEKFNEFKPDLVVAVGGGSPIDAAKIMALFYEYPKLNFDNVFTENLPQKRYKTKFIAIPSTSGTASEVTHVSVITFKEKDIKLGIKAESLRPDIAILDGNLPCTLPYNIAVETGIDALTHALECYINKSLDDFTEVISKGAIEGIIKWLPISCKQGDAESRQKVHNYQCMAGMGFSNAGLGMVHGISHAFGGKYNLAHGLTNAIILPYSMDYNKKDPEVLERYETLSKMIGSDIILKVKEINKDLGLPRCIQDTGITEEQFKADYDLLVNNAMKGSTVVNPIKISIEDMRKIINCVYYGEEITF